VGAVVYNIEADQGGTVRLPVAVTEADGSAADLSGFTGEMQVWSSYEAGATLLATAVVEINSSTGVVTGTIDGDNTLAATWRSGVYDLVITDGAEPEYIARGNFKLRPTVTR